MEQLSLVQSLQDLYAEESGLSVLLTNDRGEWLTRPSGAIASSNAETGPMRVLLQSVLSEMVQRYAAARSAIVCDVAPGVWLFMAPVFPTKRQTYYLWAGCIVDGKIVSGSRRPSPSGEPDFPWTKTWSSVPLVSAPLTSASHTEKTAAQIGRLAAVVEGLMRPGYAAQSYLRSTELLRRTAVTGGSPAERVKGLADAADDIDFAGFAAKTEGQRFTIDAFAGQAAGSIEGLSFSLGEGFVGQVATTRKAAFWDHADQDPRTFVFAEHGLHPTAFFCVPVMRERELAGILFGGSVTEPTVGKGATSLAQAFAAGWSKQLTLEAVRIDRDTNFTRLSTFVETCGAINQAQDAKRLSYILVDMSLNLVEGPFCCVVLKQSSSKVQLVSRGLGGPQAERYVKEVAARWSRREGGASAPAAELCEGPGMPPVLECPLYYQSELLGVWCIALKEADQYVLYRDYMTIVAQAASSVIYRLWDKGRVDRGDVVQLLNRALGYWDSYAWQMTHEAQELALAFARSLKLSDGEVKHIGEACLIYPYSPAFLGDDLLRSPELMAIIQDFHALIRLSEEHKTSAQSGATATAAQSFGTGGQLIAMIYVYLQFNRDPEALDSLAVSAELRSAFRAFCDSRQVVEAEIEIGEEAAAARETAEPDLPDMLKELPPLSSREQEVLGHVLQGKSNREIAERLVISEHTVKNHMTNIFHKLGVTDRAQAIALVYKAGWNR
ncbi:LuxR C-terminal-related transcriptional regulator [Paenibacillus sp. GYB003]|uniref:LuxR C-terminal-related transcriptional regulator n=1 Tax=Paenibacillus sp. GYB003 TaxID=2994392 RepID=UPI002F96B7A6